MKSKLGTLKTNELAVVVLTIITIWVVWIKYTEYSSWSLHRYELGNPHDGLGDRDTSVVKEEGDSYFDQDGNLDFEFDLEERVSDLGKEPKRNKWRSATTRKQSHAIGNAPLPDLDALPVFMSKEKLMDVFVTQKNYEKLLLQYASKKKGQDAQFLEARRSFPTDVSFLSQKYDFSSCAVVGNSGTLLNGTFGNAIDSHSTVIRINQAMTNRKYQRHVGSKTTFRLINTRWTNKYADPRFLYGEKNAPGSKGIGLPLEDNVTLISSRSHPKNFDRMVEYLGMTRSDVTVLYLSSRVVSSARRTLVGYRVRLDEAKFGPYYGGSTPSSGFLALYLMLNLCNRVTAYGFGLDAENGAAQGYHYFDLFSDGERKKMMNPTHSFDAERDLMRALGNQNFINYCGYIPHNRKHNKHCGKRTVSRESQPEGEHP